jgi:hypothetical protein
MSAHKKDAHSYLFYNKAKKKINTCMNRYLIQVRIKGQLVKTTIEADSVIHARLIAEWHFGIGSVSNLPTKLAEANPTPNPRIDALKRQKDNVSKQLKAERARQKIQKAQQQINSAQQSLIKN